MFSNKTSIRVRYADTDKMQFVYNGKYFEYFEVGRTELLRSAGLAYSTVESEGYQLPLIEAGIKFLQPAYYDDMIEIEAFINDINTPKVHIQYIIRRQNTDEILAEGFTTHIFINIDTKKATRPPKIYLDVLRPYFEKN
ncbi:acyl-CoA thioesterase [Bacteroidota bacterium]